MKSLILIKLVVLGLGLVNQITCDEDPNVYKQLCEYTRRVYYDTEPKSLEQIYTELQDLEQVCIITNDPNNPVKRDRLYDVRELISYHDIQMDAEKCFDRLTEIKRSKERFRIYQNLLLYIEYHERAQMKACSESMRESLNSKIAKIDEHTRNTIDNMMTEFDGLRGHGFGTDQVVPIEAAMAEYLKRKYGAAELKDKNKFEAIVRGEILEPCQKVHEQLGKQAAGFYLRTYERFLPLRMDLHWLDWFERSELCRVILDNSRTVLPAVHKIIAKKSCTGCFPFLRGNN